MEKSKWDKIIILVISIICIVGVTMIKITNKNNKKEEIKQEDVEKEIEMDSMEFSDNIEEIKEVTEDEVMELNQYLQPDYLETVDTSNYDENAGDSYDGFSHVNKKHEFVLTNEEILGNLAEKEKNIVQEGIQFYLDNNIEEDITEVTINEKTVSYQEKEKTLTFEAFFNNGKGMIATIDFVKDINTFYEKN